MVFFALMAAFAVLPWEKISSFFLKLAPSPKSNLPVPVISPEFERRECIKYICAFYGDFESFWCRYEKRFVVLNREQVEIIFAEYMSKVMVARDEARLRKERWRQRIIFWNQLQPGVHQMGNEYRLGALAILLLYLAYEVAGSVWNFLSWCGSLIVWLFTDAISFSLLWFIGKLLLWFGVSWAAWSLLIKIGFVQRFVEVLLQGLYYISLPFFLLLVPVRWIKSGCETFAEFASVFYEENCPPIILVNEDEAAVESVAQNGEEV